MRLHIYISSQTSPRIDRGASLDWRPNSSARWLVASYHDNAQAAQEAFDNLRPHLDRDPAHYRISCHVLDIFPDNAAETASPEMVRILSRSGASILAKLSPRFPEKT